MSAVTEAGLSGCERAGDLDFRWLSCFGDLATDEDKLPSPVSGGGEYICGRDKSAPASLFEEAIGREGSADRILGLACGVENGKVNGDM